MTSLWLIPYYIIMNCIHVNNVEWCNTNIGLGEDMDLDLEWGSCGGELIGEMTKLRVAIKSNPFACKELQIGRYRHWKIMGSCRN